MLDIMLPGQVYLLMGLHLAALQPAGMFEPKH